MYALDFEYDNRYLSDFGFIICDFGNSSGANTLDAGSKIVFDKVPLNRGMNHSLIGTHYDECIKTTFDICKNPNVYHDLQISNEEYLEIVRWLNRKQFLKLHIIDDEHEFEPCYYNASFNIEKIKVSEVLYGLKLEMTTDRPFGYGDECKTKYVMNSESLCVLHDTSDEIGCIYPNIEVTVSTPGDLILTNKLTKCKFEVKNCSANETIYVNGLSRLIKTSLPSHDIYNDFNYDYFSIGNTIDNRDNEIITNLPCILSISYAPIIKNSPN